MSTQTDSPTAEPDNFFMEMPDGVSSNQDEPENAEPEAGLTQDSTEETDQEQPEGPEASVSEETDSEKEKSPKDDPDAFQFYQSRYDKAAAKLSKLGIKPEEIPEEYVDLLGAFHGNPEYLEKFSDFISNGGTKGNSQKAEETPEKPKKPAEPEKPANYDPLSAYQDPDSESFIYQRKYEKYLADKAEFAMQQNNDLRQELQSDKQQRQQQSKQEQVRSEWEQMLKGQRGYDDQQVEDFFGFVDKASNGTFQPGEVIQLYEGFSGVKADAASQQNKAAKKEEQAQKKKDLRKKHAPSPASAGGAGNPGGKEPENDGFFQERSY